MPGIIPMKLIKCGSSQTRIAQACDRCRSKKIRCDGVRPCCSQCANVGFECKTSDKLSRRAFPRGYTESLEERVRCLEREVRELKDLLDAKDEQLDMLSRIHSFSSPYSPPASATSGASHRLRKSPESVGCRSSSGEEAGSDEMILVGGAPQLMKSASVGTDRIYMGSSSGKPFIDLFRNKMNDTGRYTAELDSERFFEGQPRPESYSRAMSEPLKAPPRMLSDHLVVSYFQEFHPLFPVLHQPTIIAAYERMSAGGASLEALPKHMVAQLFLIFSIALLQSEPKNVSNLQFFDVQWQQALDAVVTENNLGTVQCLVLAQLYCFARGDYARLLQFKSLAVGMALRLGLNHSQRRFQLGALAGEMRKRTFWCVYCLDSFSAAMVGLPKLLKEEDVEAEYPSDIDDDFVTEEGFLPTLPGDSTKISSAIALFRGSRVLTNVLNTVYPGSASHELSYAKLKDLEDELDAWKNGLAPHLRLEFVNGSPSTNLVGSRSPLLVLAYHYIKMLIHLPIAASSHAHHASASAMTLRESSKCIVQIVQLLTERKLGFAFCLNKPQLLVIAGFAILYSAIDTHKDGTLAKDNQKLIGAILDELRQHSSALEQRFRSIAALVVSTAQPRLASMPDDKSAVDVPLSPHRSPPHYSQPHPNQRQQQQQQQQQQRRRPSSFSMKLNRPRASSQDFSNYTPEQLARSRLMSASLTDLSPRARSLQQPHLPSHKPAMPQSRHHSMSSYDTPPNLDYLWSLDTTAGLQQQQQQQQHGPTPSSAAEDRTSEGDWERTLAMMDATHAAHIYGDGGNTMMPAPPPSMRHHSTATATAGEQFHHPRRFHTTPSMENFSAGSNEDSAGTVKNGGGGAPSISIPFSAADVNVSAGDSVLGDFLAPMIPVDVHADSGWGFEQ